MAGHRDFTLPKYQELLRALRESGYAALVFGDYFAAAPAALPERLVLLRHDVESSLRAALRMAACEQAAGMCASYFFRSKRSTFRPAALRALRAQGHEIGYHYETLAQARGDIAQALALFRRHLERLREVVPVATASMHGSPLSPWDNRAIWDHATPADFGLRAEVYRDLDYRAVAYFSDTGRTWHPTRYNIRDRPAVPPRHALDSTDELIALVRSGAAPRLCLLTHCERWSKTTLGWGLRGLRDGAENLVKIGLARVYAALRHTP